MTDNENPFAEALARHVDGGELRTAFEACNREPELERYDRTSLSRWLTGSIPSRGDFVATLAEKLGDLSVYEAWFETRRGPSPADVKAVVTRFQGLPRDQKDDAFRQIRDNYVATSLSVRSRVSIRVELDDAEEPELYRFRTRLAMSWIGHLPERATVVFANDDYDLITAYESPSCIFRDVVASGRDSSEQVFGPYSCWQQVLSYRPSGGERSRSIQHVGSMSSPGRYEFPNDGISRASIMLRVEYPTPHGRPIFPFLFKRYMISGPITIAFTLNSRRAHSPHAFAFLGNESSWELSALGSEIVLEAGAPGELLRADTGVIFSWSEGA